VWLLDGPRDDGLRIKQGCFVESFYYSCTSKSILIWNPDQSTDLWAIEGDLALKTEGFDKQVIVAWGFVGPPP
jgi:hypothetical protein